MSTPEWSIFDRLDELEDITLGLMEKAETTEPTLKGCVYCCKGCNHYSKTWLYASFPAPGYGRFKSKNGEE